MYKQGDFIKFDFQAIKGRGKICGIATSGVPMLGQGYIVELLEDIEDYNYTHIVLYEIHMKKDVSYKRDVMIGEILE